MGDLVDELGPKELGVQAIGDHPAHGVAPSPEVARDRDDRHEFNLVESAAAGGGGFRRGDTRASAGSGGI